MTRLAKMGPDRSGEAEELGQALRRNFCSLVPCRVSRPRPDEATSETQDAVKGRRARALGSRPGEQHWASRRWSSFLSHGLATGGLRWPGLWAALAVLCSAAAGSVVEFPVSTFCPACDLHRLLLRYLMVGGVRPRAPNSPFAALSLAYSSIPSLFT